MKYLVMECHPAYAVVLDEKGRFIKVANFRYQVGQTVEHVEEYRTHTHVIEWKRWLVPIAVAACLFLVLFGAAGYYMMPYGFVHLAINPEVELTVNRLDRVIGLEGENDDGDVLIQGYEHRGKTLETVARELTDRARELGFLTTGGTVRLELESDDPQWITDTRGPLIAMLQQHLGDGYRVTVWDDDNIDEPDDGPEIPTDTQPSDPPATNPDDDDPDDDDDDDESDD